MNYENTNEIFSEYLLCQIFRGKKRTRLPSPRLGTTSFKQLQMFYHGEHTLKTLVLTTSPSLWWLNGAKNWQWKPENLGELHTENEFQFRPQHAHAWLILWFSVRNCKRFFGSRLWSPSLFSFPHQIRYKGGLLVTVKRKQSLFSLWSND